VLVLLNYICMDFAVKLRICNLIIQVRHNNDDDDHSSAITTFNSPLFVVITALINLWYLMNGNLWDFFYNGLTNIMTRLLIYDHWWKCFVTIKNTCSYKRYYCLSIIAYSKSSFYVKWKLRINFLPQCSLRQQVFSQQFIGRISTFTKAIQITCLRFKSLSWW
jgi:hypothetical protein